MAEKLAMMQQRAEAAERDRDWWMTQHDAVMEDWRADVEQSKAHSVATPSAPPAPLHPGAENPDSAAVMAAVDSMLQFFNPSDGSVLFQKDGRTLSETFKHLIAVVRAHQA